MSDLLPVESPLRYLAEDGVPVDGPDTYARPSAERLLAAYRKMVVGRRFGYDPKATRVAPQCMPLATQALHATGLA